MFRGLLSLSTVSICLLCLVLSAEAIKGVHPDKLHLYENESGVFRCFDGRLRVPFDRVNDDFCDCQDGSDEPGTSACPNGQFYCRNRGHTGKTLSSSFVNDGVCDCCDGSDEERGCNNYCAALGSAVLKEKKELLAEHSAGAELRAALLRDAATRRESWLQQEALLIAKTEQLRPVVSGLLETRNAVEAEKNALAPAPEPVADVEEEEEEEDEKPVEWKDPRDPAHWAEDDEDHDAYHDGASAAQDSEEPATEAPADEEDPDEVGRRIAAQWTSNPEAVGPTGGAEGKDTAPAASDAGQQCVADGDQQCANPLVEEPVEPTDASKDGQKAGFLDSVRNMVGGLFGKNASTGEAPQQEVSEEQKHREDVERRLREAEDAWRAENDILSDAERRLTDLQTKLKRDHGPDGLFSYLDGSCYDWSDNKYTYTVCGFGQATQKEGGSATSLGSFSGFEDHHTAMMFTGGAVCWQGPARSLRVELKCGSNTQLLSVTEPNRCQYISTLLTPAACSPQIVSALESEIAELEQAVSSVD